MPRFNLLRQTLATAVVVLAMSSGCDVTDPTGDDSGGGGDAPAGGTIEIHLTDAAGDCVGRTEYDYLNVDIVPSGANFVVTLTFTGDIEALDASLAGHPRIVVQFRMKAGGPYPELFFTGGTDLKVAGGAASVVDYAFTGNQFMATLNGFATDDIYAIRASSLACDNEVKSEGYDDP